MKKFLRAVHFFAGADSEGDRQADSRAISLPIAASETNRYEKWLGAFSHHRFAVIWFACTLALTGLANFDTASSWLMTSLNTDPRMISMVSVAINLPMFLMTFIAGTLADLIEPRRFLILLESTIAIGVFLFSLIVFEGWVTPTVLLSFTFFLSTLWSLTSPAWMSITPQLVPERHLNAANAANSIGWNISRAIGPTIAGFLVAKFGLAAPYLVLGLTEIGTISALIWWRPAPRKQSLEKPETILAALQTGLRQVASNKELRATIIRTSAFSPFACASMVLLPLVARNQIQLGGSEFYGILLSTFSVGAVIGSVIVSRTRRFFGPETALRIATGCIAVGFVMLGLTHGKGLAIAALLLIGSAQMIVQVELYVSALLSLPDRVRARGISILLTVIFACNTLGSLMWGQLAARAGIDNSLFIAAVALVAAMPLTWRWKLRAA